MDRQQRADAVDREMAVRLLPDEAVGALVLWWSQSAERYADATPGAHAIDYTPSRWAQVTPWPASLAPTSTSGDVQVSRADVALIVADALKREAFTEALVATYVWGKGKRGTRGGSGPATLQNILAPVGQDAVLGKAVTALGEHGSQHAYAALHRRIAGLGPSFFTKFLYFAGKALRPAHGPGPLILDHVLSQRLRSLATVVGRETGYDPDGEVAAWVWADWDWSPHRYEVYLSFMQAASRQMAATSGWPSDAEPDLLECAMFNTDWKLTR
ncbi:hypothetical protein [Streptomyces tropicalis]|uniref:Uncharacterized protein n=1 Tax=Streptomyces tropicalis TaxID=3034234 RepID=A0ABT6A616_9ACTN|nr:hypothetical protein [Streptomyces tropicalis]MDF3300088.1 hypothetical protein [Streptomyces tropicalis]